MVLEISVSFMERCNGRCKGVWRGVTAVSTFIARDYLTFIVIVSSRKYDIFS